MPSIAPTGIETTNRIRYRISSHFHQLHLRVLKRTYTDDMNKQNAMPSIAPTGIETRVGFGRAADVGAHQLHLRVLKLNLLNLYQGRLRRHQLHLRVLKPLLKGVILQRAFTINCTYGY